MFLKHAQNFRYFTSNQLTNDKQCWVELLNLKMGKFQELAKLKYSDVHSYSSDRGLSKYCFCSSVSMEQLELLGSLLKCTVRLSRLSQGVTYAASSFGHMSGVASSRLYFLFRLFVLCFRSTLFSERVSVRVNVFLPWGEDLLFRREV